MDRCILMLAVRLCTWTPQLQNSACCLADRMANLGDDSIHSTWQTGNPVFLVAVRCFTSRSDHQPKFAHVTLNVSTTSTVRFLPRKPPLCYSFLYQNTPNSKPLSLLFIFPKPLKNLIPPPNPSVDGVRAEVDRRRRARPRWRSPC